MTAKQRQAHKQRGLAALVPRAETALQGAPHAMFPSALAAFQRGDLSAAERLLRQILILNPTHGDSLHLLGITLYRRGLLEEAANLLQQAAAALPRLADVHSNLGLVLHAQGQWDAAITQYREAIALQPGFPEAHNNLGNTLQQQGHLEEAKACYQRALELKPNYVDAWTNLGTVLNAQGNVAEAIHHYRRALILDPRYAPAHYNLGNALLALDREDEAWAHFQQTLLLDPRHKDARINLGNICHARHRLPEALSWYDQVLALDPGEPKAHFHKSMVHLLAGDYAAAWPHYEYRHLAATSVPGRSFPQPQWRGEPLAGRRILLHSEQGLGDTLQFLRYVPLVERAGGHAVLLIQPSLRALVAHSFPEAEIVEQETSLPAFDVHCPLPSLPLAFHTTPANLPAQVPYLSVPPEQRACADAFPWPAAGLRVGLVLTGNAAHKRNRYRSMPPEALQPVLCVQGVHFFSLQISPLPGATGLDLTPDDIAATAAKILHLDLVLTVDTMAAHLAGSLGLPTWVMLDYVPDWRWMLDRPDSPWYPTTRLFRQPAKGDWSAVAEQVAHALTTLRDS